MNRFIPEDEFPQDGSPEERLTFLVRYAAIAPSSHNTQPWKFDVGSGRIGIHIDEDGWLRVADQDRRELHVSIGCALENLLIAAEHFGYEHHTCYFPNGTDGETLAAVVDLSSGGDPETDRDEFFEAIPRRHTNHETYDARRPSEEALQRLRDSVVEEEVQLLLTDDDETKRTFDRLVARANALQFADPEWREELGHWLGKGVFGTSWITSKMSQLAVTYLDLSGSTTKTDSELLRSAPILGMVATSDNNPPTQVKAGQVLERVWLRATTLEISLHPMNQILQVPETKQEVVSLVPSSDQNPQITFRLGYAEPEEKSTPRRELDEVLL